MNKTPREPKTTTNNNKLVIGIIIGIVVIILGVITLVAFPFGNSEGFKQEVGYSDLDGNQVKGEDNKNKKVKETEQSTNGSKALDNTGWEDRVSKDMVGYKLETLEDDIFDLYFAGNYSKFREVYDSAGIFEESADILTDDGSIELRFDFSGWDDEDDGKGGFDYGEPITNISTVVFLESLYIGGDMEEEDFRKYLNGIRLSPNDEDYHDTVEHKVDTKLLQSKYNIGNNTDKYEIQLRFPVETFERVMEINDNTEYMTAGVIRAEVESLGGTTLVQKEAVKIPLADTITINMDEYVKTLQTNEGVAIGEDSLEVERYFMDIYLVDKESGEKRKLELRVEENKLYLR